MDLRRLGRVTALSFVLAVVVAGVATPPDPITQMLAFCLLLLVFVPVGYFLDAARGGNAGA
jgi:Sec-independent protein secretion pathway component TatC